MEQKLRVVLFVLLLIMLTHHGSLILEAAVVIGALTAVPE